MTIATPTGMRATRAAFAAFRDGRVPIDDLWRTACREITQEVGSTRASIWRFEADGTAISCLCLFDARTGAFTAGARLVEADCPDYFQAIRTEASVVAPDVDDHPATRSFRSGYFEAEGIRSLLDVVVMDATSPAAVLCCETADRVQDWTASDARYLRAVADALGLAMLAREGALR